LGSKLFRKAFELLGIAYTWLRRRFG